MFKKRKKLYKFIFNLRSTLRDYNPKQCTLLITATDPVQAVRELYKVTKNDVGNIIEFTVVTPKEEEKSD